MQGSSSNYRETSGGADNFNSVFYLSSIIDYKNRLIHQWPYFTDQLNLLSNNNLVTASTHHKQ